MPNSPKARVRVITYGPDELVELEGEEALADRGKRAVTWVDVTGLGDPDAVARVGNAFGLHRLVMEDVVNVGQRAKVEAYEDSLFIVAHMLRVKDGRLDKEQVSFVLGKDFVLTFQVEPGDIFEPVRERIRHGKGKIRKAPPCYLAYALLDAVVDHYFPLLETFGESLDSMEESIVHKPSPELVTRIHDLRADLLGVRRAIWPLRDALSNMSRDENPLVAENTRLYLRDTYDHGVQVVDLLETHRELAGGLFEVYLSVSGQKLNEIMKVLTLITTFFIPSTFLAGLYGMNFIEMPFLSEPAGFIGMIVVMAAISAGMLLFFRRKGWLGR